MRVPLWSPGNHRTSKGSSAKVFRVDIGSPKLFVCLVLACAKETRVAVKGGRRPRKKKVWDRKCICLLIIQPGRIHVGASARKVGLAVANL